MMTNASLVAVVFRLGGGGLALLFVYRLAVSVLTFLDDMTMRVNWNVPHQFFFRVSVVDLIGLAICVGVCLWSVPLGKLMTRGIP